MPAGGPLSIREGMRRGIFDSQGRALHTTTPEADVVARAIQAGAQDAAESTASTASTEQQGSASADDTASQQ